MDLSCLAEDDQEANLSLAYEVFGLTNADVTSDAVVDGVDLSDAKSEQQQRTPDDKTTTTHDAYWLAERVGEEAAMRIINSVHGGLSDAVLQEEIVNIIGTENIQFAFEIFSNLEELKQFTEEFADKSVARDGGLDKQGRKKGRKKKILFSLQMQQRASQPIVDASDKKELKKGLREEKTALPLGTERRDFPLYEEVIVPPRKRPEIADELKLIETAEALSDLGQKVFEGVPKLNALQTLCFNAAYLSNENILVAAPTGSGKTNVALLTILREIEKHFVNGTLASDNFKVIYVAPMKALAQEIVEKFQNRLGPVGITVQELTGDMQLSRKEIEKTQIIVTTPEKWDVITRKVGDGAGSGGSGEGSLAALVRLLILDEVHLLNEDRGAVLETLVARTIRQVEVSQRMIRIVGLSATLPNYEDVAQFLRVNPQTGLLRFDAAFRPVPLEQVFIGIRESSLSFKRLEVLNSVAYEKVSKCLKDQQQCMVFVHSRRDTYQTGQELVRLAREAGETDMFLGFGDVSDSVERELDEKQQNHELMQWRKAVKQAEVRVSKCQSKELKELFPYGIGIHNAGMVRKDRTLVEKLFSEGILRVICCTATLAWGVNLPAHCVIIKGTEIYDSKRGGFVDIGILDVTQIFGRAGRPQFDDSGVGMIITTLEKLPRYLSLLTHQLPIESTFITSLPDNLNAEIVLGTVTNVREALQWLSYTYLYIRMLRNPVAYGVSFAEQQQDVTLLHHRKNLILFAAKKLIECRMVRFDPSSGNFFPSDLGRTASHYYINHLSCLKYNDLMHPHMSDDEIFNLLAGSHEFEQIRVRDEELTELGEILKENCFCQMLGGVEHNFGKTNILIQAYVGRVKILSPSLISDSMYIAQNVGRICRAVFHICVKNNWSAMSRRLLMFCIMIDRRMWWFETPLRQIPSMKGELSMKIESNGLDFERMRDMEPDELGIYARYQKESKKLYDFVHRIPYLVVDAVVKPITRSVIQVGLTLQPDFVWHDAFHGNGLAFVIWIEDGDNEYIYHFEEFILTKKAYSNAMNDPTSLQLEFAVPVFEPLPPQYFVRAMSQHFLGTEFVLPISFKHLILPDVYPPHTQVLDLHPLPLSALCSSPFEAMYRPSFSHFNPIQSQCFYVAYHSDLNLLLGAPTGSGKTIVAELAVMRVLSEYPGRKCVYIAPLKALCKQRLRDWQDSFGVKLHCNVVELTGDFMPNVSALAKADIVITTPEKWDGISRRWKDKGREYVKQVALVIFDEIHLLGQERGPIIEVLVSRMRLIGERLQSNCRIVGLSTALANASDVAQWLGVSQKSLFNFPASVRPVPVTVHISGFQEKLYCPRMASMNKPTYAAIMTHSPHKPVLIFVSSRRQTRLTALDLIFYCACEGNPHRFSSLTDPELSDLRLKINDENLSHTIEYGIGLHHAGLRNSDRELVEDLFLKNRIQVLIATSTLAWGVNLPAHLVIIKGSEYFDAKESRYVDMPITDILQMIGRAGRPQFDTTARACLFVQEAKKAFYRKFLYESFPLESSLPLVLEEHFNAEVVGGTIGCLGDAVDYLTCTFFFKRLLKNPSYYIAQDTDTEDANKAVNDFLFSLVVEAFQQLEQCKCVVIENGAERLARPTFLGVVASTYYISHRTVKLFDEAIEDNLELESLLELLCEAPEYDELPVRHNEEMLNRDLAMQVELDVDLNRLDSPHTKTNLLYQARFSRLALPISDYYTDTKSVLDQSMRLLQAMIEIGAEKKYCSTTCCLIGLMQMVVQARWRHESSLVLLQPIYSNNDAMNLLQSIGIADLRQLTSLYHSKKKNGEVIEGLNKILDNSEKDVFRVLDRLPCLEAEIEVEPWQPRLGEEASVHLTVRNLNKRLSSVAFAPLWPTKRDHCWWLVVELLSTAELVHFQKLYLNKPVCSLSFALREIPEAVGQHQFLLHILSDTYIGLDVERSFTVTVCNENH